MFNLLSSHDFKVNFAILCNKLPFKLKLAKYIMIIVIILNLVSIITSKVLLLLYFFYDYDYYFIFFYYDYKFYIHKQIDNQNIMLWYLEMIEKLFISVFLYEIKI